MGSASNRPRPLDRRFSVFVFAFLGEMGLNMVFFAVPLYASALGASQSFVGFIGSAYGFSYLFSAMILPRLYRGLNKNALLVIGLLSYSAVVSLYLLLRDPTLFLFVRLGEGVTLGLFWPLADTVPSRGASGQGVLAWYNTGWSVAAFAAPYLSGVLIETSGLLAPVEIALTLELMNAVYVFFMIRVPAHLHEQRVSGIPKIDKRVALFVILPGLTTAYVAGVILALYPVYLKSLGIGYAAIGVIAGSSGVARTVTFASTALVEKRLGRREFLVLGSIALAAIALDSFTSQALLLLISMLVVGVGLGLLFHVGLDSAISGGEGTMTKTSMFESSLGLGLFLGPFLGGVLALASPRLVYVFTAALPLVVAALGALFWSECREAANQSDHHFDR